MLAEAVEATGAVVMARRLFGELRLHLAPMLLGGGTPLFRPATRQLYRQRDVRPSSTAVHLGYERQPSPGQPGG